VKLVLASLDVIVPPEVQDASTVPATETALSVRIAMASPREISLLYVVLGSTPVLTFETVAPDEWLAAVVPI
jgi:hypothetical protein